METPFKLKNIAAGRNFQVGPGMAALTGKAPFIDAAWQCHWHSGFRVAAGTDHNDHASAAARPGPGPGPGPGSG